MLKPDPISFAPAPIRKFTYRFILFTVGILVACSGTYRTQAQSYADYLMPISPHRPHEEAVEKLLGKRWGGGTMIYSDLTGITGESFAVSVWGPDNKPQTLTYLKLTREGDSAKLKSDVNLPIDDEFSGAIYDAWCAILLKTRYPDKLLASTGGWNAEFSAWIQFAGGVYGKDTGVKGFGKELMDFGFALKDYCTAKDADRKAKRESMIPRLKDFAARVQESHLY
jgi:hypothetical protein